MRTPKTYDHDTASTCVHLCMHACILAMLPYVNWLRTQHNMYVDVEILKSQHGYIKEHVRAQYGYVEETHARARAQVCRTHTCKHILVTQKWSDETL